MFKARKYNLYFSGVILLAAGLCLLPCAASSQYSSSPNNGSSSSVSCNSSCSNSTCQLTLNSNGALSENCPSETRYDVDPNCIMNQNAQTGSCLDTMPVASIKRVSETNCYRANGAGGNPKPRNHLGTDYSATEGTAVTAAADGTIVWAKWMGGGGRVIIIEHEKKCQCTAGSQNSGCDDKYITVYMHLKGYAVTGGTVKRGQVIGWVGGSNYSSSTNTSCDWPNKNGSCSPYGPHLHFEIHSGAWEKGYSTLKSSIINPLCNDIQTFCGGCSYDVQQCQDKTGTNEWEDLSAEAAKTKSAASAVGSMTPEAFGADANTVYSALTGCSLERFLPKSDECWFCPMFRVLFNTSSIMALNSYNALASSVANLVIVCFALWVSLFVLRHVASVEVKDPRKMIQEFLVQAFRVLVVVLILKVNFFQVISLTLEPVFNTGMTFVQTITGKGTYNSSNPNQQVSCPADAEYMKNIMGYDSATGFTKNSAGGLPASMGQNIVCSIKSVQDSVSKMMAYGRQAICVAWRDKAFIKFIIPSFPYLITGLVIYLGGLLLLIVFPWCLVDAVLQMSVATALAPAAIGAWAFKAVSKYLSLKKLWDFFMNAMFNFVFLSIIIYIIMTVVDQFMRSLNEYAGNTTGWDFLIHPIHGLAYWGITGTKLVVICLMGWVFLDEGKNFAGHFAKGADMGDIGRHVGGAFAQGAKKVGNVAKETGKKVGGAALQVGDHFVGSRIRKARNNYRINRVKSKGTAIKEKAIKGKGRILYAEDKKTIIGYEDKNWLGVTRRVNVDKDGKIISNETRNLIGQKVTRQVDIGEDGKESWSKSKTGILFKKGGTRVQSDHLMSVREKRDADGNVYQRDIAFNTKTVKHLINKDGTVNMNMVNQIVQGSNLDKKVVMEAVAMEVLKARGMSVNNKFNSRQVSLDRNGVIHLTQQNFDGSTTELTMGVGGGHNKNQMLTELKTTRADGSYTVNIDNGIMNKSISYINGNQEASVSYGFNDEYYRRYQHFKPINSRGEFAPGMDAEAAMFGFGSGDRKAHARQVATGRPQTTGANYEGINFDSMFKEAEG